VNTAVKGVLCAGIAGGPLARRGGWRVALVASAGLVVLAL
jgi:hypothetical protein